MQPEGSNLINDMLKLMHPLRQRVANMVARALVTKVDDNAAVQGLQLALLDGETRGDVERVQNYGFTSVPAPDAEAVVASPKVETAC